jgi:hypothetical protein
MTKTINNLTTNTSQVQDIQLEQLLPNEQQEKIQEIAKNKQSFVDLKTKVQTSQPTIEAKSLLSRSVKKTGLVGSIAKAIGNIVTDVAKEVEKTGKQIKTALGHSARVEHRKEMKDDEPEIFEALRKARESLKNRTNPQAQKDFQQLNDIWKGLNSTSLDPAYESLLGIEKFRKELFEECKQADNFLDNKTLQEFKKTGKYPGKVEDEAIYNDNAKKNFDKKVALNTGQANYSQLIQNRKW